MRKWSRPQQIIFGEVYNKTLWSMKKCYNHINVTTFRSGRWCISRFIEEIHLYMWTFRGCFVAVVQSATLLWNCNSKIHSNPNLLNQILTFFIYSYNVNNFFLFSEQLCYFKFMFWMDLLIVEKWWLNFLLLPRLLT